MLKQLFYNSLASKHMAYSLKRLRDMERKLISKEMRFAVPFAFRGKGYFRIIEPRQNPYEIEALYKRVCELNPRRVLEIGTARGGTLYLWAQAAAEDATLVSVDLPGGDFGGAYPQARVPFYQAFAREQQHMHLLREDSHQTTTLEQVTSLFGEHEIDFAFIDGDHTYEGVKQDFEMYGPLVRPGGIIGFHDIVDRPDVPGLEVNRFWDEIKQKYEAYEFIGPDGSGKQIGIGIVVVGSEGVS